MKIVVLLSFFSAAVFIFFSCAEKASPELSDQIKNEIRQDARQFTESLKTILVKEMQTNGITAALSVCSDTAQTLTDSYGSSEGIKIKRISFKNRNPKNIPDEFEAKVLRDFEELKSKGNLDESSEYFDVSETDGAKNVRYLKPIIIQAPCLSCHGATENIGPDVQVILNTTYPEDKATGYRINDLRGAVSIIRPL